MPSSTPSESDAADLLVLGGGMAGLSAAARAVALGARVLVVERAPRLGGSALYAGYLWTGTTGEAMHALNPHGAPELTAAVVDGFPAALALLADLGVSYGPPVTVLRHGTGHQFDTAQFVDAARRRVTTNGEIVTGARTERLRVDDGGAVTGADLLLADGTRRSVRAPATVLATGGFQADAGLRADLVHPQAERIALRSNEWSRGDGLRLARQAGGRVANRGGGFYGHLIPAGVALEPELFVDLALYYSEHAVLFNLKGERFVDETAGDHLTTMALLDQPEARGLLVTDAHGYREWGVGAYVEGAPATDKFALARRRGGRCVVAESPADFAEMPPEWGYDGAAVARELTRIAAGAPDGLGRRYDPRPLDRPPYYVVEVAPAITFPFAGIEVDRAGRVLGETGPVAGLYAAGSDIGGLYAHAYAGGLAPAVVFGMAAAEHAVRRMT
ncbi:FAD-binding protein [Amycolatopsis solani]|uniref:FAD-binding protein n=1 Tax=Amycolatopsis solani TaxID=3028615 RepID=UPI00296FE4A4|nr:FAD-binding protein [Amycolatopsis sp. MEP2-6]